MTFSHLDDQGNARMVDVGEKEISTRTARATAIVRMNPQTAEAIQDARIKKGDVLAVARIAGIMAAKRTDELIPLCHSLALDVVDVTFSFTSSATLQIEAFAKVQAHTGVEMEALVAATTAAVTVYDMCKSIDRGMTIEHVKLEDKTK